MKCASCNFDIDPKWKHAIDANVCPFCGQEIVPEDLRTVLTTFSNLLDQYFEKYESEILDWFHSNLELVRADSVPKASTKTTLLTVKKDKRINNEEVPEEGIVTAVQDQEVTNKFFKNAQVSNKMNDKNLKDIVKKIKKSGGSSPDMLLSDTSISEDELIEVSGLALRDDDALSGLSGSEDFDDIDSVPDAVLRANKSMAGNSGSNNADIQKLQQLQDKTAASRKRMLSGGGGFTRSG